MTALGSILLAGMAVGIWKDESEIALDIKIESYAPNISDLGTFSYIIENSGFKTNHSYCFH